MSNKANTLKTRASRLTERPRRLLRRMRMTGVDPTDPDTKNPMGGRTLIGLVLYLTVILLYGGAAAWGLWTARPPVAPEGPWPAPTVDSAAAAAAPVIGAILPDTLVFGVSPAMRIFGTGFAPNSQVLLDGVAASGARFIPPNQMRVELTEADFRQSRSIAVTVTRDTLSSRAAQVRVESESQITVWWTPPFFSGPKEITIEARMILIVFLLGLLGGTLSSFNSLSSYRGEGKLVKSWFLHYWVSPVLGAGVALFMYIVVRAGFLAGTNVQIDSGATPWGLAAVSGLAGLFYDKTLLKLREVFLTLFAPKDDRSGKLVNEGEREETGLKIATSALEPAVLGATYHERLEASGGEEPYSWSVRPDLPGGLLLDPMTGVISGQPTARKTSAPYEFTVSDMKREVVAVTLDLEVRGS